MDYNQFISIVPADTAKFTNEVLNNLTKYNNAKSVFATSYAKKIFEFNTIPTIYSTEQYSMVKLNEKFDKYKDLFLIYDNVENYVTLRPSDIILNVMNLTNKYELIILFDTYLGSKPNEIYEKLKSMSEKEATESVLSLDKKYLKELPANVYELFKYASIIRNYIIENKEIGTTTGIEPLTLILAIYFSNNKEANEIEDYLKTKNINIYELSKQKICNMYKSDISSVTTPDYNVIEYYYMPYIEKLKNLDEIKLSDVISLAFDKKFTNSSIIDTLLNNSSSKSTDFINLTSKFNEEKEAKNRKELDKFYNQFDKQTRDFINLVFKIYTYVMQQVENNNCNTNIIKSSDDVDTLSIFIASYFYNGSVSSYFIDNCITLEKVLEYLKLNIPFNELNNINIDISKLISIFKRYVNDGRNSGESNINYSSIINNLCDRKFNKSYIMEEIYGNYVKNKSLPTNFYNTMRRSFEQKQKEKDNALRNEIFNNMDYSIIEFIEIASNIYQSMKNDEEFDNLNDEDLILLSLLYSVVNISNNDILGYLKNKDMIINVYPNEEYEKDLNLIKNRYQKYMFEGKNKDKKREEITIEDILSNAFNTYTSIELEEYINDINISIDDIKNIKENIKNYQNEISVNSIVGDGTTKNYIMNIIKVYNKLSNFDIDTDKVELSILLAYFECYYDFRNYFLESNINQYEILKYMNLPLNLLNNLSKEKVDYSKFSEIKPYFDNIYVNYMYVPNIILSEFQRENNILEPLCNSLGSDYNQLKAQIMFDEKYNNTISLKEKIEILSKQEVDDLDISNVSSLVKYGSPLSNYTKSLELPTVSKDDTLSEIENILERIRPKKEIVTRGFFFSNDIEVTKPGETVTPQIISELREKIDKEISTLQNEVLTYADVIEYIKAYVSKSNEYVIKLDEKIEEVESKMNNITDEELRYTSKFILDNLKVKKTSLKSSIVLWKQEQLKYMQLTSNHLININALNLTRDSLLPLISSETLISTGLANDSDSLKLQGSIIELLDSLINNNALAAKKNIEEVKKITPSLELIESIENTLNDQISKTKMIDNKSKKI